MMKMRVDKDKLKKRAAVGVFFLSLKRAIVQVVFTGSNIFLARLLFPEDFGTFAILQFVLTFFTVFSDVALSTSLIQKKEKIDDSDLQTAFSFQLLLSLSVVIIIFFAASTVSNFYNLGDQGVVLFRLISLVLLLVPFKTIAGAVLERELMYFKLVNVEILEILLQVTITVFFAFLGFGVFSFVIGLLAANFISAITYTVFYPWKIRFRIKAKNLIKLSKFGLPLQINTILGLFYGPLVFLYLGKAVGVQNLGYFQFAASMAVFPLAVSDIIGRIIFPLGSRLQGSKQDLRLIMEKSISVVSLFALPMVLLGMAASKEIITFVYGPKWLPAQNAVLIGLVQISIVCYTAVFSNMLLAKGNAKVIRNMGIFWGVLTWIIVFPLVDRFNFVGMSITSLIVSASGIWLYFRLKRDLHFAFLANFLPYLVFSVVAVCVFVILSNILPSSLLALFFKGIVSVCVYLALLLVFMRKETVSNFSKLYSLVRN